MDIKLNEEETVYLLELLKRETEETKTEIRHSDSYEFKGELKNKVLFIQDLINKFKENRLETTI